jgi:hypothetical protein
MNPDRQTISSAGGAMTEHGAGRDLGQRLSCLLDGEADGEECRAVLERLREDDDARRQWAALSCVGDALRSSDVAAWHSETFVARVATALEREPTVLAPAALAPRPGLRRWLLPAAGAAAAAVLVAVGLPSQQQASPDALAVKMQTAPAAAVAEASAPILIDRSPVLERYLAAHRELSEPTLMPNSTPYLRTSGAVLTAESR